MFDLSALENTDPEWPKSTSNIRIRVHSGKPNLAPVWGAATVSGNGSQSSRPRSGNCVQAVIDLLQKEVGFVSKLERAPRAVHIKHRAKA
jgi:hypothetical protein